MQDTYQDTYVVIDLETTGHAVKNGDAILEVGLVVLQQGQVVDRFQTLINPQTEIPSYIQTLTGITPEMVEGAPLITEVLPTVRQALAEGFFVAHHASFDWTFLQDTLELYGYPPLSNPVLDTVELARMLLPTLPSYSLGFLTEQLEITHEQPHRALSDAESTAILLLQLLQKLDQLPLPTLQGLWKLAPHLQSDWVPLLEERLARKERAERGAASVSTAYECEQGVIWRASTLQMGSSTAQAEVGEALPTQIADYFNPQSPFSLPWQMKRYEERPQQQAMMERVLAAFNRDEHLLVEAGTGMGKTLGYALPSILWALQEERRVVWSTHTLQLQDQILYKELPLLRKVIPVPFKVALRKGIQQYLCLEQFFRWLEHEPRSYDDALARAQLLIWLLVTETGDLSELNLPSHGKMLLPQLTATSSSCKRDACPWYEQCFYQRAKLEAREAQIVVVNHALLAQELRQEAGLLPPYDDLVIDEAHQFVETLAQHWTIQVESGLVKSLVSKIENGKLWDWFATLTGAPGPCERFKKIASAWLQEYLAWEEEVFQLRGEYKGQEPYYIRYDGRNFKHGASLLRVTEQLLQEWESLSSLRLDSAELSTLQPKMQRLWEGFRQFAKQLPVLLSTGDVDSERYQYWVAFPSHAVHTFTLLAIPLDVATQLAHGLFATKGTVILTSATLTVKGSFKYIRRLLGVDTEEGMKEIGEATFPSPYTYEKQMQILVPQEIPLLQGEDDAAFVEEVAHSLAQVVKEAGGGCLVLFTAKEMLRRVRERLLVLLDGTRIQVLAQGVDSNNRTRLTQRFQAEGPSVLLGTASFWEGVDIPGDALRLLAIVRLPFARPDDPYYQTRVIELGIKPQEAFFRLALPQAILRLRQGIGRLIRSQEDRGLVILYDRRVVASRYGKQILRALPAAPFHEVDQEELVKKVQTWFHG